MRSPIFFIITIFFSLQLRAQIISGNVTDETDLPIELSYIYVKNPNEPDKIIEYTITDKKGNFRIETNLKIKYVLLEVSKFGYKPKSLILANDEKLYNDAHNFKLKESITELESVTIKVHPRPIKVANDTVTYRLDSFKDGSERTVEDVLKKLPGIEVNEDGSIKYKGRSIVKVLIEGDDLFDNNYMIGTKNVSANLIEQVQALEKYTENPLLKGIEDSNKVALNLKLKNGQVDLSGNGHLGLGTNDKKDFGVNVISISKKNKNFSLYKNNNIGLNPSQFDYFSFKQNPEDLQNRDLLAKNIIKEDKFYSSVDDKRANLNNNTFTNFNNILRISKKLDAKINFSYYKDKLNFKRSQFTRYSIPEEPTIETSDEETIKKNPKVYDGSAKLTWNIDKNNLLEYGSKYNINNIITQKNNLFNQANNVSSSLESMDRFMKQEVKYTNRINNDNAFQLTTKYAYNSISQDFKITPGFNFETDEVYQDTSNFQNSKLTKHYFDAEGLLLGKKNKKSYQVSSSVRYTKNNLKTNLVEVPFRAQAGISDENKIEYNILETNINLSKTFEWGRYTLKTNIEFNDFRLRLNNFLTNINDEKNKFLIAPNFRLTYLLKKQNSLTFSFNYNQTPIPEDNIYTSYVLSTSRNIRRYEKKLFFSEATNFGVSYLQSRLFKQFIMRMGLNHSIRKNNFFNRTEVNQNVTKTTYFFLDKKNTQTNLYFSLEKYIPFLNATGKVSSNYSVSEYINVVNSSSIRNNTVQNFYMDFSFRTVFDFPVNLENTLTILESKFKNDSQDLNKRRNLKNKSKILFKPSKNFYTALFFEYYLPDNHSSTEIYFFDAELAYRTKNKKWEFSLQGKNLTDNKVIHEINISDFYYSSSQQSLLERYIMMKINFQF